MTPIRIQRKRTKGWRMPENCRYVGRGSEWGNPFVVGRDGDSAECVRKYAAMLLPYTHAGPRNQMLDYLISQANFENIQRELRGKHLACWCKVGQPCHGDWLLELANSP